MHRWVSLPSLTLGSRDWRCAVFAHWEVSILPPPAPNHVRQSVLRRPLDWRHAGRICDWCGYGRVCGSVSRDAHHPYVPDRLVFLVTFVFVSVFVIECFKERCSDGSRGTFFSREDCVFWWRVLLLSLPLHLTTQCRSFSFRSFTLIIV